jgi:probable phosphoglycerate mutase
MASDLGRAQETAGIIAGCTGHEVISDHRLRERHFGVLEGLKIQQIKERFAGVYEQLYTMDEPDYTIPGGESHREHYLRNIDFFNEIIRAKPGRCIALVVHGGVLDSLLRFILRADLRQPRCFMAANTSLSVIHHGVYYGTLRWMVETWGDVSHLDGVGFRQGIA